MALFCAPTFTQAQERVASAPSEAASPSNPYQQDALSLDGLINDNYAYLDRFADGRIPMSEQLRQEAGAVEDADDLLRYAERALHVLADHHASTGRAFADSWALVPTYSDLWIERDAVGVFRVTAVRADSPAERLGIVVGDALTAVGEMPTELAVQAFWADLGISPDGEQSDYAARILAAGRRDRRRDLTILGGDGIERRLELASLYEATPDRALVEAHDDGGTLIVRFNNSLGESDTIAAFDHIMAGADPGQAIVIDLTDTPSGGNTVVARGVMGWFVDQPRAYQVHSLPGEERRTTIARQWIEQVLPRAGHHHSGPVTVRVGRWTASMGEGLAIGFQAIGARVVGDRMSGLLGGIYNYSLDSSGLTISFPAERLYTVDGLPREAFTPDRQ